MKIAIATHHFPPLWGGVSTQNYQTAKHLVDRGHEVHVFIPREMQPGQRGMISHEGYDLNGINLHVVEWKKMPGVVHDLSAHMPLKKALLKFIAEEKPDVLDVHELWTAYMAAGLKKKFKIPYIWTLHGHELVCPACDILTPSLEPCKCKANLLNCINCFPGMRKHAVLAWKYLVSKGGKNADVLMLKSQFYIDEALKEKHMAYRSEQFRKISYWADTSLFTPLPPSREFKEKYLQKDCFSSAYFGGINRAKGVDDYLNAVPLVLKEVPDAKFLVIGKHKAIPAFEALDERSQKAVVFVDPQPHNRLPLALSIADVSVHPDRSDAYNWALVEAMACGKAIIATDVSATREAIDGGENGVLVPAKSPQSIAEKLVLLAMDRNLLEKLAKNARKKAVQEFDSKKVLKKVESVFLEFEKR